MSSEAHAPYVRCPILLLNSTNDFHGWMDSAYDTLSATPAPHWQVFTPRYNHHIGPEQGASLPAWMDFQLKSGPSFPNSPTIDIVLGDDGVSRARVTAGEASLEGIDVFYSLGDKPPPNRFWRSVRVSHETTPPTARLEVVDPWEPLTAFANVRYASGVCLTTNLARVVPARLGKARGTLASGALNRQTIADGWVYATAYTDPHVSKRFVLVRQDSERGPVVLVNPEIFGEKIQVNLVSHVLGDPQFAGNSGDRLAFDCRGFVDEGGLTITLFEQEWTPRTRRYTAKLSADAITQAWDTVALAMDAFRADDGKSPARWKDLDKIQLQCATGKENSFEIANLRFSAATD
jgi:hypothetical protein